MKGLFTHILAFGTGALVSALVTNKILRDKYRAIADEEIESVKIAYGKTINKETKESSESKEKEDNYIVKARDEAKRIIHENNYVAKTEDPETPVTTDAPYYIESDEYGTDEDYQIIQLYHYSDGVLADDIDERANASIVPPDYADQFAHTTAVYVRNPRTKADYEIIEVDTTYAELCEEKPHLKYRE